MSRTNIHDHKRDRRFVPGAYRTRYIVVRQDALWFIKFDGEEYGPYNSEREAMLFAVEAAHMLGQQGEPTQVLLLDESGEAHPEWTYGLDPLSAQALIAASAETVLFLSPARSLAGAMTACACVL